MFGVPPRIALLIGFDLAAIVFLAALAPLLNDDAATMRRTAAANDARRGGLLVLTVMLSLVILVAVGTLIAGKSTLDWPAIARSEEHTSELQSQMRISYAVFCLKKKKKR